MTLRSQPMGYQCDLRSEVLGFNSQQPSISRSVLHWTDTRDGVENPRYKSQVRSGVSATTRLTGSKSEVLDVSVGPISATHINSAGKATTYQVTGVGLSPPAFFGSSPSLISANNTALGSFYSSARGAMSAMQGMTFLGEIAETVHMLKKPGSALRKGLSDYLRSLKKASDGKRTANQLRKALSGTFLEYVFGWVPLCADINDALKAYNKLIGAERSVQCRGFGSNLTNVTRSDAIVAFGFNPSIMTKRSQLWNAEAQVIYYGKVRGVASGVSVSNAADLFGFRIDEFVPTLWEILPWSFLVDYFTNIGDIVSATSYVNTNLAWTAKTTRLINTYTQLHTFDQAETAKANPSSTKVYGGGSIGWSTKTTSIVRDASSVGIPSLEFSLPGSNARWANISALLAQSNMLSRLL